MVIVDDYTRWTWVRLLTHIDESFDTFYKFCKKIQNEKDICISSIKSDHVESMKMIFLKNSVKRMTLTISFSL